MEHRELASIQARLEDAIKSILVIRSELSQRETRMSTSFNQQIQSLQQQVGRFQRDITGIVGGASSQIAKEAKDAVAPVAAQYDRAVSTTSAHLQGASRTVWLWFGAAGSILLLVLLALWMVLGYYRRELAEVKHELQRYENAIPVLQAYHASDVVVCGERLCANVDANGQRMGEKRQYRQVEPRPQK